MPALESRRVRTHPLTVAGVSADASPARISRTLNTRLSIRLRVTQRGRIVQRLQRRGQRAQAHAESNREIFKIDSNKRSVAVDVVRHPALKQSNGSLFAKRRSEDHGIREGDTSRIRTSR